MGTCLMCLESNVSGLIIWFILNSCLFWIWLKRLSGDFLVGLDIAYWIRIIPIKERSNFSKCVVFSGNAWNWAWLFKLIFALFGNAKLSKIFRSAKNWITSSFFALRMSHPLPQSVRVDNFQNPLMSKFSLEVRSLFSTLKPKSLSKKIRAYGNFE